MPVQISTTCAESVDDEGRKYRSDVLAYDNVGNFIEFGRFTIDNHQTSAVSFGKQGESGGRPHHQRRADREKKITVKSQLFSASHFALRHRLTEGNRRRRAALLLRVREARGAPCVPRLSLAPLPLDIARLLSAVATVGLGGMVRDDEGGQSGALCFPRASPVL